MKNFVFLYSGGTAPTTPAEGEASMKEWMAWFEGLGSSVKEAGEAFASSRTVTKSGPKDGPGGNISNGYSILQANDLAGAAGLVKQCPIIAEGGKVHVFDLMAM
jgi:hypothetical protein